MLLLLSAYQLVDLDPTHLLLTSDPAPLISSPAPENQVRRIQKFDLAELLMAEQMTKVPMLVELLLVEL